MIMSGTGLECLLVFAVMVVLIVAVASIASRAQARADRWNRAYQTVAKRYGGACLLAGWFGRPSVRFRYGAAHVLVNTYSTGGAGGGPFTQLYISWPDPNLRLEIFPDWGGVRGRAVRGLQNIETGNAHFDERFVIRGNNPAEIRVLLNDAVRWQIDRLRNYLGIKDVYLAIHRGGLVIKKPSYIRQPDLLEEFVTQSLELFDQAMLTRTVGIQFVNSDRVQVISDAVCQVCGEDITTDMVFCRRCKTPHHQECWEYFGSCSTYGCKERRYIVPRLAGPASDPSGVSDQGAPS